MQANSQMKKIKPIHEIMDVQKKIALILCSHPPGRDTAQSMARFLKEDLSFDSVTYSKGLS
jgi:hypothetical protein